MMFRLDDAERVAGGPLHLSSQRLSEGVYDRLVDDIRSGALAPGDPLRDRDIAERLGVSRTPVREAIQRLERAGLLDVWPGRQTRVRRLAEVDTQRLYEYFGELSAMHIAFCLAAADAESNVPMRSAARALAAAHDDVWGTAFTELLGAVAACDESVRGRLLEDQLPLMSIVLRALPEPAGDRRALSAALCEAVDAGSASDAATAVRALFGLSG